MGKPAIPKRSLDSSRPIWPPSVASVASSMGFRTNGKKFLSNIAQARLDRMNKKAKTNRTFKCLQEYDRFVRSLGFLKSGSKPEVETQCEDAMEKIVLEVLEPKVSIPIN